MRIGVYARKSQYTEEGDSIEAQINICKEYCERQYSDINYSIYQDDGWSGRSINRPGLKKLIFDIENDLIDCIVVYRLDRISRSLLDFSNMIELINRKKIYFVSVKEQFDTSTPIGRAMMYISSVFAQLESETIGERITDNMYRLAEKGLWLGGITPTGYKSIRVKNENDDMAGKISTHLVVDEESAKVIQVIFESYIELKSISKVVSMLRRFGYKARKGGEWEASAVSNILSNPVYVKCTSDVVNYFNSKGININGEPNSLHGILTYGKSRENSIYSIGKHIGIIEADVWLKVQEIMNCKKKVPPRLGMGSRGWLTSVLRCSFCGSNMAISYKKKSVSGKQLSYYVCSNKKKNGKCECDNKNINSDKLNQTFLNIPTIKDIIESSDIESIKMNNHNLQLESWKLNLEKRNKEAVKIKSIIGGLQAGKTRDRFLNKLDDLKMEIMTLEQNILLINEDLSSCDNADFSEESQWRLINDYIDKLYWDGVNRELKIIYNDPCKEDECYYVQK